MNDFRKKRTKEEMDSIPTVEQKYELMFSDTIRSMFVEEDKPENEIKHFISVEEISLPENFNRFFLGGLMSLYNLYLDLTGIKAEQLYVTDFISVLNKCVFAVNIETATKEAIENYKKNANMSGGENNE